MNSLYVIDKDTCPEYDNIIQNLCNSGFRYTESLYASVNLSVRMRTMAAQHRFPRNVSKEAAAHSYNSFSHFLQ